MPLLAPSRRRVAALAGLALLTLPLAACGDDDGGGAGSAPAAVASIDALRGKTTAVKLDKGFTDALSSLGVTPGVVGTAKLVKGSLVFPITGGNVTVFEPGEVSPYVIGQVQHEGSGLTLSAGGTTVRLSNLNVDPGVSRVYGDVAVNGRTAVSSAFLFQLDGRTLNPLKTTDSTATLQGTKVLVSPVAAKLLNSTYGLSGKKAIPGNFLVGVATITVALPRG
ncbi:hypothetical protein [Nocardioides sp. Leaf374]|uniref:hypothetical protein n=1 Tax=Nocardioides sp. Leaf374 TaxID=2876560 RepID=UPI001E2E88F1|nr:hypothetical protein [Nocardioides sp. Leaf374]